MNNKYLISIIGPTAIGKTALAIQVAGYFNTEILSSDSRQFYKEMRIGTAVPDKTERAAVPHHFIQDRSVLQDYTVGDFEREAVAKIAELHRQHQVLVMTGGSGLYVDAVLRGFDAFPDIDPAIRRDLKDLLLKEGISVLQEKLKDLDPETYRKIDLENSQRLIRALEVCLGTGLPYSSFLTDQVSQRNFIPVKIGLTASRDLVYDRINRRVDQMMEQGLLEEVKSLIPYKDLNALQTVGYKELFLYLEGQISLAFAVEEIKKNSRRFAKRQYTWFNKDKEIRWFDFDTPPNEIIDYIENFIKSSNSLKTEES